MTIAVIDTNVLVSALMARHEDSATVRVMNAVFDGLVVPLHCAEIVEEYREVLGRPRLRLDPRKCDIVVSYIEDAGVRVPVAPSSVGLPDEDDRPFYDVAVAGRPHGAVLVTGNIRHFPSEPFILTPAAFCKRMGL